MAEEDKSKEVDYKHDLIVTGYEAAVRRFGEKHWNAIMFSNVLPGYQAGMTIEERLDKKIGPLGDLVVYLFKEFPDEMEELVHASICMGIGLAVKEKIC